MKYKTLFYNPYDDFERKTRCCLTSIWFSVVKLKAAAKILDCDLDHFRRVSRITKSERDDRNLLVFCVWKTGKLTNDKIGKLFGVTYSSISHIVKTVRSGMEKDRDLKEKYGKIYSLFKI